jgi:hypothetical protein
MKKVIILLSAFALFACEKSTETKDILEQPETVDTKCDCYVYELKSEIRMVNGKPVQAVKWEQGRYWGDDCSDDGYTFQENGGESRQVRCTEI